MALFRPEAVQARDVRFAAQGELGYPLTLPRLFAAAGIATAAAIALACTVTYTDFDSAPGTVRMGTGARIAVSGQRGIVHFAPALARGATLGAQALIATVEVAPSVTAATSIAPQGEALLGTKKRSLADAIAANDAAARTFEGASQERLRNLDAQGKALQAQLELLHARGAIQQAQIERNADLLRGGFISPEYEARARSDGYALKIQEAEVRQRIADMAQQAQVATQDEADKVNQMRTGRLRAEQDIAEIDSRLQSSARNRSVDIRSATAGRVAALHVDDGDFVVEDTPLATIEPSSGPAQVVCLADARAAGGLRAGAPVRVSFPAFPYLIYGLAEGTVDSVDSAPWLGEPGTRAAPGADPRYRVVVRLDHPERLARTRIALVAGMAASVQVPRATRTLFQWLFLTHNPNDR